MKMNNENYLEILRGRLSEKRFNHSLEVQKLAVSLAKQYNADTEKASVAGLLHDITKDENYNRQLQMCEEFGIILTDCEKNIPLVLHALTGALYIEYKLNIKDKEIINAVRYHTTGRKGMTLLEKIIYISDMIEPSRSFEGVDNIRNAVYKDIDKAMLEAVAMSAEHIAKSRRPIHMDTIECYNDLIINNKGGIK